MKNKLFSFSVLALSSLLFLVNTDLAFAGCCSKHGGATANCGSNGKIMCGDGTGSPSCACPGATKEKSTKGTKTKKSMKETKKMTSVATPSPTIVIK